MKKVSEYLFLWTTGGCIYYGVECLFRGFSHWTMFLLGGVCFFFCTFQGIWLKWSDPFWKQLLRCMIFVTACEFITGIIVNKWLCWQVWDYTDLPFQLFGQICIPFMLIFSGLCALGIIVGGYLLYWLYGEERPKLYLSQKVKKWYNEM
ncbi:MAG: hypothetical protein RR369_00105 [Lachnospiraceae bacterium]